ncbi:hypothetical protein [Bailinhaonella thermotolerans]|uniref:Uncharacterized protein n=1 Tax=Bailinhaonella thermotolerans TaxID=1070861 RepID=A0A3A4B2I1_9ACTN|nr:hypothetical protein [Bailinhaonella thermotolerans]RJL34388.1 hypothetical protein D5H75_08100 [Bailinhaonella thermotolerans]
MTPEEGLLAALRIAVGTDPVPEHVRESAEAAFAFHIPGAVLAEPLPRCRTAGASRGDPGSQLMRFEAAGSVIEVELTPHGDRVDLAGRLTPAGPAEAEIRTTETTLRRTLTPTGQFAATGLSPGWLSVVCHPPTGTPITTPWIRTRR